jgi:uncharacterized membrane protein YdfJ with MMPL/SSD domain
MGLSRKLLPYFVVAAWILLTVGSIPAAGRLSSVAGNPDSVELPRGADATRVAALAGRFPDSDVETGILGYVRDGGLTGADRASSAGIVLAATFAVLTLAPFVAFVEIGFVVAVGVLIDTLLVRSVLVPALALDVGRRFWWPSQPRRSTAPPVPIQSGLGQSAAAADGSVGAGV